MEAVVNRPGRPAELDRNQLLDAAEALFSERGFDGASTREIARRAKCNVAMISYHFGGKEGLYEAVLQRYLDRSRRLTLAAEGTEDELARQFPEFKDPAIARFCSSLFSFGKVILSHQAVRQIILRENISGGKRVKRLLMKSDSGGMGVLRGMLAELQRDGKLDPGMDLGLVLVALLGPLIYSCTCPMVLKEVYGFREINEEFMRRLAVHLTKALPRTREQ